MSQPKLCGACGDFKYIEVVICEDCENTLFKKKDKEIETTKDTE